MGIENMDKNRWLEMDRGIWMKRSFEKKRKLKKGTKKQKDEGTKKASKTENDTSRSRSGRIKPPSWRAKFMVTMMGIIMVRMEMIIW